MGQFEVRYNRSVEADLETDRTSQAARSSLSTRASRSSDTCCGRERGVAAGLVEVARAPEFESE